MNYLFLIYIVSVLSIVSAQTINLPAGITLDLNLNAYIATGATILLPLNLPNKLIVKGDLKVTTGAVSFTIFPFICCFCWFFCVLIKFSRSLHATLLLFSDFQNFFLLFEKRKRKK